MMGMQIALSNCMKNNSNQNQKQRRNKIFRDASEEHEEFWGRHEQKKHRKRRSSDQYSPEYLAETIRLQQRNPFDYRNKL